MNGIGTGWLRLVPREDSRRGGWAQGVWRVLMITQ